MSTFLYTSDAQLVASVIKGNQPAILYMFYDHYLPLLRSNFNKVNWNKPVQFEDLLQELYLYVSENDWQRLRRYDPTLPFANWFSVVSFRFFRNFSRSMIDSSSQVSINEMNDHNPTLSTTQTSTIMMDILQAITSLWPPRDRQILEALLLRDEDPVEVAHRHNVTVENLYNIKRRALAKLIKNHLTDYAR